MAMLGVIGGSGLYAFPELRGARRVDVATPFGAPSDAILVGELGGTRLAFVARHGGGHRYSPRNLPYLANVYAMKALGVTHLLSVSAVGSLREDLPPRSVMIPDQIVDRTEGRVRTFFEGGVVAHVGIAEPFCPTLRAAAGEAVRAAGGDARSGGTYVCIEGPQFSTKSESMLHRAWEMDVVGMTAMPEARLAREAELCYATVAMVTDYDAWHEDEAAVTVELVLSHLQTNVELGRRVVQELARAGLPPRACGCGNALSQAIVTAPDRVPPRTRRRLGVLVDRYLPPATPDAATDQ